MGRFRESRPDFWDQRRETSALESGWKMDRFPLRPRGRERERPALVAPRRRRGGGEDARRKGWCGRFRRGAGVETDGARGERPRSARAGEKGKKKEDGPAVGHQPALLQEGY